jgi:hypothetical protein
MSYELSDIEEYTWNDATFGATTVNHQIIPPKGKVGFLRDVSCDVTTTLVGTAAVPEIDVGLSTGDATFGRYRLGTTAILGYPVGMHRAGAELIPGNPPRLLADYPGHIVLDGGPYGNSPQNNPGGSVSTQAPLGRIPAGLFTVLNAVAGTAGVVRLFVKESVANLLVGQTVQVQGINGATSAMTVGSIQTTGTNTISAINTTGNWIELTGTTFAGAYTSGGFVNPVVWVTCLAGVTGSAGGGIVRVKIEWVGHYAP